MAQHCHHINGDATDNRPENIALVGEAENARALEPADIRTLGLLLQRHGLLWVTMALAELTTAQELADQAKVLRAATEFYRSVREDTATFDGKMSYAVTVNYRTNSGCNSRRVVVEATSTDEALDLAHEIVRRRRGVIRIDGGTIDGRPAPPK